MAEDFANATHISSERPAAASADPGVKIPVPFVHLGFLALGLALHTREPLPMVYADLAHWLGVGIVVGWCAISFISTWEFARAGTSMLPYRPSSTLITWGPYGISRNPIYLSLALIHFGIGLWAGSGWLAVSALPCIPIVDRWVIRREERYLEQRFGAEYRRYAARVRRWI